MFRNGCRTEPARTILREVTEGGVGVPAQPSAAHLSKQERVFPLILKLLSSEMKIVTLGRLGSEGGNSFVRGFTDCMGYMIM